MNIISKRSEDMVVMSSNVRFSIQRELNVFPFFTLYNILMLVTYTKNTEA